MIETLATRGNAKAWQVGALCRAIADSLDARFNPVNVVGEVSGFVRASSGHCYFSLKDASGQLRCAMFRRAAGMLDFQPKDGELVEVRARLGVYEPRGELQLVVESMSKAGQGTLFEQFLQIKARLEQEGLFEAARKRPIVPLPRAIGVVTSLGAAAWHDTMTALRRRVPHIPVMLAPASVQGANAPAELIAALEALYAQIRDGATLDIILLVRGGGAIEDLWAFNDELLARTVALSPVPVISGVGHETDFTIVDFVADLRAPTPTAAAELAAVPTDALLAQLDNMEQRVISGALHWLDREAQSLDRLAAQISRPSALLGRQAMQLARYEPRIAHAVGRHVQIQGQRLQWHTQSLPRLASSALQKEQAANQRLVSRLKALDPHQVLQRGFVWLMQADGSAITRVSQTYPDQALTATLGDGTVDLRVTHSRPI
jgi:exodeoxyribonuclease VII large subunit